MATGSLSSCGGTESTDAEWRKSDEFRQRMTISRPTCDDTPYVALPPYGDLSGIATTQLHANACRPVRASPDAPGHTIAHTLVT